MTLPVVLKSHPEVNWVRGLRYVDDGRFVSTAGVTSGIDGTLYVLQRFFGRDVAEETAQRIGYPHLRFLDDPTWVLPEDKDLVALPNLFRFGHTQIGMLMYPGVDELALSSVTDTYPRSLATDVLTIGLERQMIKTRHGLDLVPRYDLTSVGKLDRMFIPGQADAMTIATVEQWAAPRLDRAVEQIHPAGVFPYDATFADLARHETRPIAANAARWIEYPIGDLQLAGPAWQPVLMLRALVLSVLGVVIARGIGPAWRLLRRPRRARTISRPTVTSSGTP
jgi:hypothetical protein